ncbi:hypothetical protein [Peterkaempfera sp. SMS 1(5)a]|uniref:hypothetical protein n=1 Tax=Peterkaempfera podocarpi TaxID=3232308 RepID=UPI003672A8FD
MSDRMTTPKWHRNTGSRSAVTVGASLVLCAVSGVVGSLAAELPFWEQAAVGVSVCVLLGGAVALLAGRS